MHKIHFNRFILRLLISFIIMGCALGVGTINAYADHGPKPSIKLKIINPPGEEYMVGFLSDSLSENDAMALDDILYSNNGVFDTVDYADAAEYIRKFGWPASDEPLIAPLRFDTFFGVSISSPEHIYTHNYFAPDAFRIFIITQNGNIYISNHIDVSHYHAVCIYDFRNNQGEEVATVKNSGLLELLNCYLATIFLEFVILVLFNYPLSLNNLKWFIIINTVTNPVLSGMLILMRSKTTSNAFIILWVVGEILIVIFEGVVYSKKLKTNTASVSAGKGIWYSIIANLVSAMTGGVLVTVLCKYIYP